MTSIYRPRPATGERLRYTAHSATVDGVATRIAFDPRGEIDSIISSAATTIGETGLAVLSEPAYVRGALRFETWCFHTLGETSAVALSPWKSPPKDVLDLFSDFLRGWGAGVKLERSTSEKDVWHVEVTDEGMLPEVSAAICGTFHLYAAASDTGLYAWPNPFEVPTEDRTTRRIPGPAGGTAPLPTITPRFRFRIPMGSASALRTDARDMLRDILPALEAYGAPPAIVMMIATMIEGLARISEQIALSVLDWWDETMFGQAIATTSKGRRRRRVKAQRFTPQHHAALVEYFDTARTRLDPNGWTLEQWRAFLTDPTIGKAERRRAAARAPLFPNARGGFYSRSGVLDHWYRPAMRAAGLPTRTHYIRHCGVNDFLAYIEARPDLTAEEKIAARLAFAKAMGWKWPEAMLERYSLPQRKEADIAATADWLQDRHARLNDLRSGAGTVVPIAPRVPGGERGLSRLVRHRVAQAA